MFSRWVKRVARLLSMAVISESVNGLKASYYIGSVIFLREDETSCEVISLNYRLSIRAMSLL